MGPTRSALRAATFTLAALCSVGGASSAAEAHPNGVVGTTFPADFPRIIELTLAGKLKVEELISRRYTLDQINEGFDRLSRGEVARGVIVF